MCLGSLSTDTSKAQTHSQCSPNTMLSLTMITGTAEYNDKTTQRSSQSDPTARCQSVATAEEPTGTPS